MHLQPPRSVWQGSVVARVAVLAEKTTDLDLSVLSKTQFPPVSQ